MRNDYAYSIFVTTPVSSNFFTVLPIACVVGRLCKSFDNFYGFHFRQCKTFNRKEKKKLVSQLSLTDVEYQSHISETTKWLALYNISIHYATDYK